MLHTALQMTSGSNRILCALRDYLAPENFPRASQGLILALHRELALIDKGRSVETEWQLKLFDLRGLTPVEPWPSEVRQALKVLAKLAAISGSDDEL